MDGILNKPIFNKKVKAKDLEKELSVFEKIKFIIHFISQVVLYSLFVVLILVAICFVLYFFDMIHNLKSGDIKPPLFNAYIIVSPSMVPTIKVKDAIVIKREDTKDLKVGDIITFNSSDPRYAGITITHRIVAIEKAQDGTLLFKTKGDGNNSEDSAFAKANDIYGKVILQIPKLGYVQYFLSQSYGWLLAIVIPCLSVIAYDIVKLLKSLGIKVGLNKNKDDVETLDNEDSVIVIDTNKNEFESLDISNSVESLDDSNNIVRTNEIVETLDVEVLDTDISKANNDVEVLDDTIEELDI